MRVRILSPNSHSISEGKIRKCNTKADVPFLYFVASLRQCRKDVNYEHSMDMIKCLSFSFSHSKYWQTHFMQQKPFEVLDNF